MFVYWILELKLLWNQTIIIIIEWLVQENSYPALQLPFHLLFSTAGLNLRITDMTRQCICRLLYQQYSTLQYTVEFGGKYPNDFTVYYCALLCVCYGRGSVSPTWVLVLARISSQNCSSKPEATLYKLDLLPAAHCLVNSTLLWKQKGTFSYQKENRKLAILM